MKLKELIERLTLQSKKDLIFPENLEEYLENFIPNILLKSDTLQQAFSVSAYEMEEIYSESYKYYYDNQFLEASTSFRWLVLLNPFIPKYWMGLAASLQLLEKYEKGLHAYAMTALLDSENPYPHFHAYECYVALNNMKEAEKALELSFTRTVNKDAYKILHQEIKSIKKNNYVFGNTKSIDL